MKRLLPALLASGLAACGGVSDHPSSAIDWSSSTIQFTATDLTLVVDNVTFHGAEPYDVKDEAFGDVLDVSWMEGGYAQRVHLDMHSEASGWWITDARARKLDDSDWYEEPGRFYTTAPTHAYEGNLDFTIAEPHVTLHVGNVRLAPFGIQ